MSEPCRWHFVLHPDTCRLLNFFQGKKNLQRSFYKYQLIHLIFGALVWMSRVKFLDCDQFGNDNCGDSLNYSWWKITSPKNTLKRFLNFSYPFSWLVFQSPIILWTSESIFKKLSSNTWELKILWPPFPFEKM